MRFVHLSGGVGQRLWPLSNSARSKQFLKLLQAPNGARESMIQRIWRQLSEIEMVDTAMIVTNKAHEGMIHNQLHDGVKCVVEPTRRDTFPAIALMAAYLADQGLDESELLVVCPVDLYVENEFFNRCLQFEESLKDSGAQLGLLGIEPTTPSEQFGYIVPCMGEERTRYKRVDYFVEKPFVEGAVGLLRQGALWNGGVFAFRLGTMLSWMRDRGIPLDHQKIFENYNSLPKMSFDYEIVEQVEKRIVIPYSGVWSDLGTWGSLTKELSDDVYGKAMIKDSLGTTVINELEIPILVLGGSELAVVASSDGILIADKQAAAQVKNFANTFIQRPMYEERRWGWYRVLDYTRTPSGDEVLTKRLCVESGRNLSYQKHDLL